MTIDVLDPTRVGDPPRRELASRPATLDGARLGVLDNGKPNSDRFLLLLTGRITSASGIGTVDTLRKPAIGRLAPDEQHERLVATADVVITGVGDCSGCATCTVQDALDLEAAGLPTAVVCTHEFLALARRHATRAGAPDYRFVVIEHPLATRDIDALDHLAAAASDAAVAWLTGRPVRTSGPATTTATIGTTTVVPPSDGAVCLC